MKNKKTREAELERKRPVLFFLGLAVACAMTLSAFEWRAFTQTASLGEDLPPEVPIFEAEIIPRSFPEKKKPVTKKSDVKKEVAKSVLDEFKFSEDDMPLEEDDFPEWEKEPVFEPIADMPDDGIEEEPVPIADIMPEFPGGDSLRMVFLKNNVDYPPMAKDASISGRVYVGFTVAKDGTVKDIHLKRGIGGGCDEEALKAVRNMPKWTPGFNNGRPVSVYFTMPISFNLR